MNAKRFIMENSASELLSQGDAEKLLLRFWEGDREAGDKIMKGFSRLALKVSLNMANYLQCDSEDAIEHGMFGLLKAMKSYKIGGGGRFTTYAYHCIRQNVFRFIAKDRVGTYNKKTTDFNLYFESFDDENSCVRKTVYCNEDYENVDAKDYVSKLLSRLSPRDREIISKRFGINGEYPHTLEEIAIEYDLTREAVRQIQVRCFERMREYSNNKEYNCFVARVLIDGFS